MPPWICTAAWPTKAPAWPAWILAAHAAWARACGALAACIAATWVSATDCSSCTYMSAMRCCSTWKLPIGTPNCLRWRA
ncbi:hypothetical protein D3C87_2050630 [compost metagenome]